MATTAKLTQAVDAADPFVSPPHQDPHRQRYSAFNNELFSLYANGSPSQAKRALEAHLAETERRLQEASHLGTVLVQQRKELGDRLRDVERQQEEHELGPDLRDRLVELEREFNEVGKDTARAFLPRSRVPSGESPEKTPHVFTSEASMSPSKVSVPTGSRKQRNQPPSRVHDIKLATEISSSLLQQLRDLQQVLADKDDALRNVDVERSRLEIEVEGLNQRLRALDESEQRYKDENWNLETRLQDVLAASKEHAEREKRINQSLTSTQADKSALERELEELRQTHAKLADDHTNISKHLESEVSSLRRNVAISNQERAALQRKIDDLSTQNQELAKAITYRARADEQAGSQDDPSEQEDLNMDDNTPDHSPPASPTKGTPRHGQLEAETLKSSLHHAHRLIQNLKNNIHREKTEKIELKRMLQDARDELDQRRTGDPHGNNSASKRKKSKNEEALFKKPSRPDRLGAHRSSREEITFDEPDWEDQEGPMSPSKVAAAVPIARAMPPPHRLPPPRPESALSAGTGTDDYHTATENEDAFETANEREGDTTETDAFHTGAESLDGASDDGDLTETETASHQSTIRGSRPSPFVLGKPGDRSSFHSTASTSADELDEPDVRTPVQSTHPRYRIKVGRGSHRRNGKFSVDMHAGTPPSARDSPASFASNSNKGTPVGMGQSLAAELGNLSGDSDGESYGTPSRSAFSPSSALSPLQSPDGRRPGSDGSPLAQVIHSKPEMVDSSVMTEPWEPESHGLLAGATAAAGAAVAGAAGFILGQDSKQEPEKEVQAGSETSSALPSLSYSTFSNQHFAPVEAPRPATPPVPALAISTVGMQSTEPVEPAPKTPPPHLAVSEIASVHTVEPLERILAVPPQLAVSEVAPVHIVAPVEPIHPLPPSLELSGLASQHVEPIEPTPPAPVQLGLSVVGSQHVEPAQPARPEPATLAFSSFASQDIEPVELPRSEPSVVPALIPMPEPVSTDSESRDLPTTQALALSNISSWNVEPKEPTSSPPLTPAPSPAPLSLSQFSFLHTEPAASPLPVAIPLSLSSVSSKDTAPIQPAPVALSYSDFASQNTQPALPKPVPLSLSTVSAQDTQPASPAPVPLSYSDVSSLHTQPTAAPARTPLSLSGVSSQHTEPQRSPPPIPPTMVFSSLSTQHTEPKSQLLPAFAITGRSKSAQDLVIAEDNTSQPAATQSEDVLADNEGRTPFKPIAANYSASDRGVGDTDDSMATPKSKPLQTHTADDGTQTLLSAEEMDRMMKFKPVPPPVVVPIPTSQSVVMPPMKSPRRGSGSAGEASPLRSPRRPGSPGSLRSRPGTPPPLPLDHKEVIAAAAQKTGPIVPGTMGPPLLPASAYKKPERPQSPSIVTGTKTMPSPRDGTTPRATFRATRSQVSTPVSRRSSVSSFASELDQRFNMRALGMQDPLDANITDPRMIQAITQTMIGEWLWKYTRKAGREDMSQTRHRRFFWVHPYTRTLYWSEHDPSTAGSAQLKAKSVAIEGVQVVTDDNPMPPGLHRKSLIVFTPGRTIKFTATTGQRHDTWFNALSYLLLRTSAEREEGEITSEDVNEFNPAYQQRSSSRATGRSRVSALSSHTANRSINRPVSPHAIQYPSLTSRHSATSQRASVQTPPPSGSLSGRFSSMFRPTSALIGSISSRRSRSSTQEVNSSLYEASTVVHDSAEDLRQVIEQQEREAYRLENVRACCDGKHDVGSLSRTSRHSMGAHRHSHSHREGSSSRLSGTLRSRRTASTGPNNALAPQSELEAAQPS